MKTCPACGSSKINVEVVNMSCDACGFVNDSRYSRLLHASKSVVMRKYPQDSISFNQDLEPESNGFKEFEEG